MKVKEPQQTWNAENEAQLKYETVTMVFDGKNHIVISDEENRWLNEGNRKQRKHKVKIFNKKYGITK